MQTHFDRTKCLQDLEDEDWGEPTFDSHLVRTCHRLRRKPLNEFSAGDLRIMIGQQLSLFFLVPLAIEKLEQDPLIEGDFYPGDLLQALLRVDDPFWHRRSDGRTHVCEIARRVESMLPSLDESDRQDVRQILGDASAAFEWRQSYGP